MSQLSALLEEIQHKHERMILSRVDMAANAELESRVHRFRMDKLRAGMCRPLRRCSVCGRGDSQGHRITAAIRMVDDNSLDGIAKRVQMKRTALMVIEVFGCELHPVR